MATKKPTAQKALKAEKSKLIESLAPTIAAEVAQDAKVVNVMSEKKHVDFKRKFNTLEAVAEFLDPEKVKILKSTASKHVIVGAKDAGKTIIALIWQLYTMEADPFCSHLSGRKFAGDAKKRIGEQIMGLYNTLRGDYFKFYFPVSYRVTQAYFLREKHRSESAMNQKLEFTSFENIDGVAGAGVGNGGYFGTFHIDEPSQKNDKDSSIIDPEQWKEDMGNIMDTLKRIRRDHADYRTDGHEPFPFKLFITFNDWDEEFIESQDMEHFVPVEEFLNWMFAGYRYKAFLGNRELLDKHWDEIKESLLKNTTYSKKVMFDERNGMKRRIDTEYTRVSKFANPKNRKPGLEQDIIFEDIYNAFISDDKYELARVLGMTGDKTGKDKAQVFNQKPSMSAAMDLDKVERIKEQNDKILEAGEVLHIDDELAEISMYDTTEWLHAENHYYNREILSVSIGWDLDVNRRAVATPVTVSATRVPYSQDPNEKNFYYTNHKILVHEQVVIPMYGKGQDGSITRKYTKEMDEMTVRLVDYYTKTINIDKRADISRACIVDDMQGAYLGNFSKTTSNGIPRSFTSRNGDWAILKRQNVWQIGIDNAKIVIDYRNKDLMDFLEGAPRKKGENSKKRSEKGKYEKLADFVNSAEAALFVHKDLVERGV